MKTIAVIAALLAMTSACAYAADWEWPTQMNVGGFQIVGIRGSVAPNGSGTANGTIQIPNLGNGKANLTRSVRGDITGTISLDTRAGGGSLRGSFTLTSSGLRGRGAVECYGRSIDSPDISISSRGEARGSGRLNVGRSPVSVNFILSSSGCSITGDLPVRIQADTSVATYKFDGRVSVRGGNGLTATLSGRVERTGKLSNQVTSHNIPNTTVNLSSGQCTINVGGVSVTFSL